MRELLRKTRYDSLAKCHLYKLETNVFLEIVELVSELARCIVSKTRRYIFICRKSASRFSRGTVLNTLKQSRINIMRGKNDATTYPDKPVS